MQASQARGDTQWQSDISQLDSEPGVTVYGLDVNSLFSNIINNKTWLSGTAVNVTTESESLKNPNYNNYLFWDGLHPTSEGHIVLGEAAFNLIDPPPTSRSVSVAATMTDTGAPTGLAVSSPMFAARWWTWAIQAATRG